MRDHCDWMLNRSVFQQINTAMSPLEMDLFASQLTKQLLRFYSWRPDQEAEYAELGGLLGLCQPSSVVFDTLLSHQVKETSSMNATYNTFVENPTAVPTSSGTPRGFSWAMVPHWSSWCQQRGRDPLSGPIEDVVNFLAGLYSEGYQ